MRRVDSDSEPCNVPILIDDLERAGCTPTRKSSFHMEAVPCPLSIEAARWRTVGMPKCQSCVLFKTDRDTTFHTNGTRCILSSVCRRSRMEDIADNRASFFFDDSRAVEKILFHVNHTTSKSAGPAGSVTFVTSLGSSRCGSLGCCLDILVDFTPRQIPHARLCDC